MTVWFKLAPQLRRVTSRSGSGMPVWSSPSTLTVVCDEPALAPTRGNSAARDWTTTSWRDSVLARAAARTGSFCKAMAYTSLKVGSLSAACGRNRCDRDHRRDAATRNAA